MAYSLLFAGVQNYILMNCLKQKIGASFIEFVQRVIFNNYAGYYY